MRPDSRSAGHATHFQYRGAVDGLRGVAILAVLGFHAFRDVVPGGYVGVDVFFVISGFLITGIVVDRLEQGKFTFADFYWRRVRRLFPALAIVLFSTLALGWLLLLPDEYESLGKHVAAAAAFAANFTLWREAGYFDTAAEFKPLLHLWSLGIEEQFYLVWPPLLALLWRSRTVLRLVLLGLVIASFAISVALSASEPAANFYSPFSRFWELGVGCLLALLKGSSREPRPGATPNPIDTALPILGFVLIAISLIVFDQSTPFPGLPALLPVLGTLMILASPEQSWFSRRVLASRPLVGMGLISYALYLWHWPLLSFANILQAGVPPATVRWGALALSFVLATLTYKYVEVPVRRRRDRKLNLGLIAAVAVAGITGAIVYVGAGVERRYDVDVMALQHAARNDPSCLAQLEHDGKVNYCRTRGALPPQILVLGDSRAQAIYEGAEPLLPQTHSVMLLGRGGCPPMLNVNIRGYDHNEAECPAVWQEFVGYIDRVRPKVVVIVGNGSFLVSNPKIRLSRTDVSATTESNEAVLEFGIRSLLSEITRFSKVIYLSEIPAYKTAPSCFLRAIRLPTTSCAPERDRHGVELEMAPYDRVLERVQQAFPEVQLVNAVDVLCAEDVCSQRPLGKPILYSDSMHLSPAGGRLLVEHTELTKRIAQDIVPAGSG